MDSSTETGVRGKWKGELLLSVVHEIFTINGLSMPMRIAQYMPSEIACAHVISRVSDFHMVLCAIEADKAAKEIWTCDLFGSELVLCVTGGDRTEYLWGVLYYVLLHVLNQYNIHIVGGFQLYAFPELHTMLMCACDWCFIIFITAKLMINIEEVMYYACIPQ